VIADKRCVIRYGTAKKCDYDSGSTAVLRIPNIQRGELTFEDLKYADFDKREVQRLQLEIGDMGADVRTGHRQA